MKKFLSLILNNLLPIAFVLAIMLGFAASWFPDDADIAENRSLAPFPQKFSASFPQAFEKYYQDHFPRRHKFIKKYNKFRFKKFGINNFVFFGQDDWLFYNSASQEESNSLHDYLGDNLYHEDDLEKITSQLISQINKLKKNGADVYVMFPPNKMTLYPEKMPPDYQKLRTGESRRRQITEKLRQKGIKVIPLLSALQKAKSQHDVYLRTDSHWNKWGGFIAYRQIAQSLGLSPAQMIKITKIPVGCGDLNGFVKQEGCRDINYELTLRPSLKPECQNVGDGSENKDKGEIVRCASSLGKAQKLLVVRDSFFNAVYPYLGAHFQKSVYLWRNQLSRSKVAEIIESEKPDIIILEYVERFIDKIGYEIIK